MEDAFIRRNKVTALYLPSLTAAVIIGMGFM